MPLFLRYHPLFHNHRHHYDNSNDSVQAEMDIVTNKLDKLNMIKRPLTFMKVPGEIRELVYSYVLIGSTAVYGIERESSFHFESTRVKVESASQHRNILRTCKAV